jgi:hypothetical protein
MYNQSASPTLTNCTFSGNTGSLGGGMYNFYSTSPKLKNCIVWGTGAIYNNGGAPTITYSDIQGGYTGVGNLNADPQFVRTPSAGIDGKWGTADDDYGDLRLRINSPCIDAGSNAAVPAGVTTDAAGNTRFVDVPGVRDPGAIVDMGAYEYVMPLAVTGGTFLIDAPKPSVRFTFNGDVLASSVTAADLVLLNRTTGLPIDCGSAASVSYDAATRTARWLFAGLLPDADYRATLPTGSVTDVLGNPLAGGLTFDFFCLGGDANHDRKVDLLDFNILVANWCGTGKHFSQGDFNYDGTVDSADLAILSRNWQRTLTPPPVVVRPPSRIPVKVINLIL